MSSELATVKEGQLVQQDQVPVPIVSESNGLMTLVERMATDKEIDPDRVDKAFAMYKEVRAMDAEAAFNCAMAKAQSEIESVMANKKNDFTKSSFATLSAIHQHAKPVWTSCGLSVVSRTAKSDIQGCIKVICEVRHSSGHKESHEDDWPIDNAGAQGKTNKTLIQAKGSTSTYARRYTELMIFDIAISDMDNDGNSSAQTISASDAAKIKADLQNTNSNVVAFCQAVGCQNVDAMPAHLIGKARNLIQQKLRSQS